MDLVLRYRDRVKEETLLPKVNWRSTRNPSSYHVAGSPSAESADREKQPVENAEK